MVNMGMFHVSWARESITVMASGTELGSGSSTNSSESEGSHVVY